MILIVSNSTDLTSTYLCKNIGRQSFRLDTDLLLLNYEFSITGNNWRITNKETKQVIDNQNLKGCVYRRPENPIVLLSDTSNQLCQDLSLEVRILYESFLENSCTNWLNEPYLIRRAENKLIQLKYAERVGFHIPGSLVTNSFSSADSFRTSYSTICIKPFHLGAFTFNDSLFVPYNNTLTDSDDLSKVANFPVFLQQYIEKSFELRITVVGKRLFAIRIDSQANEETKYDWRVNNCMSVPYEVIDLDQDIANKCLKLNQLFNLNFSAMDIIIDKKGNSFFLDLNPNGQWAWLDEMFNLGIAKTIGDFLWQKATS
jgi:hypothetical protein